MNDMTTHGCGVFKEAWHKVKGLKRHFWGGSLLVILMGLGGFTFFGALLFISQAIFVPNFAVLLQANPDFMLDPSIAVPVSMIVIMFIYHLVVALYEMFILLPMRMGLRLIPLRKVADKSVHSLYVFKFISWKYIWRFVALTVLVLLAVGIPLGIGLGLFCLVHMHDVGLALTIAAYIVGALFILLALYLAVGYAFVNLLVIDRDISAWKAMTLSRQAVSKRWFCIFGTFVLLGIILILSTAILVFPLIWTVPFAHNVIAILYRNMLGIEGKDPVSLCEQNK